MMKCKTFFVVLYIVLRCLLEVIDLALDWDFYAEVVNSDQESIKRAGTVKWTIFGFAVFGSAMFLTTIVVFSLRIYTKRREGDISEAFYEKVKNVLTVLSCVCIWVEDFPQIVLAVVVAVKTTELISVVQLVKAWYALVEAMIEAIIILALLKPCCDDKPKGWKRVLMLLELTGIILILLVSAFLLLELHKDYFKETFPPQNSATTFNTTTTTWNTLPTST